MKVGIRACGVAFLSVACSLAATADEPGYRKVVLTGEPAPGFAPGSVVLDFGIFDMDPRPFIDEQGRIFFFAQVDEPGSSSTFTQGIWSEVAGQPELIARTGNPAPGTESGVVFNELLYGPGGGGGQTMFRGFLTGPGVDSSNYRGNWSTTPGELTLVVRQGDPASGVPEGVVYHDLGFSPFQINAAGHMLFESELLGPGISAANDEGIWSDRSGDVELLVRERQQAPGQPLGVHFRGGVYLGSPFAFNAIAFNDYSEMAVQANLDGPGVNDFSDEALFVERNGQLEVVLRDGGPAPGFPPNVVFGGTSVQLSLTRLNFNSLGQLAFRCRVGGGGMGTTEVAYSDHTGSLLPVTPNGTPVLSESGHLAVYFPYELHWDPSGTMTKLLEPGDPVAHPADGTTVENFSAPIRYTAAGELAFKGSVIDPVDGQQGALFMTNPYGETHVVARSGEMFDVQGDGSDLREIWWAVADEFSESGWFAFRLKFTDGSIGVFAVSLRDPGTLRDLRVGKNGDGTLQLFWSPDCGGAGTAGIYRGDLAAGYASAQPVSGMCGVPGTSATITAGPAPAEFFLVVPNKAGQEGSFGQDSGGLRARPAVACHPQGPTDACAL